MDWNCFHVWLEERGRDIVEIPPDGLCFLRALQHCLLVQYNEKYSLKEIQAKILQEIKSRTQYYIVKVCPWCGVGLLRLFFLCCGVISKLTLLLVLAAPVKRKGARGEVCFPGDPTTKCPVLFKGSRSLLLLACCYVPIGGRMLIYKGGT